MSPRPILKHHLDLPQTPESLLEPFPFAACPSLLYNHHVHFPPTPTLTSTFITHSASTYDRTPVVVLPNVCALPGRHERELFIDNNPPGTEHKPSSAAPASRSRARTQSSKESYFHPRAYEACAPEQPRPPASWSSGHSTPPHSPPPLLIPVPPHDFSSDSDSSDSQVSTPTDDEPDRSSSHYPLSMHYAHAHAHARPTAPSSNMTTASPPKHTSSPVIPHSYMSPDEQPLLFMPHHPPSSPTKERKTGKRSNDHRNPKAPRSEALARPDHPRSNFMFPSLDFEGCLGGF